ncbi:MAG: LytR/AlgR family response regulator transcription factor [Chitinophagaceae bacterium]
MINAIIIEDEIFAREKLISILHEVAPEIIIVATFSYVRECIDNWKKTLPIDLIFCDVQLPDGLSFEIFTEVNITAPVIFTTGFDKFILNAFENNGIEYLLKPITNDDVSKAMVKYKKLQKHFTIGEEAIKNIAQAININKKTRLLVKKGIETISIKLDDIVMFYSENRLVYVFDSSGKKYLIDKSLNELELELNDSVFFRANRQYIINLNFIKSFKPYEKVKLQIDLTIPHFDHFIIVSQNSAPAFRSWIMKW